MADRAKVVEKRAAVAGEGRRAVNWDGRMKVAAARLRASIINGVVLAIVDAGGSRRRLGGEQLF